VLKKSLCWRPPAFGFSFLCSWVPPLSVLLLNATEELLFVHQHAGTHLLEGALESVCIAVKPDMAHPADGGPEVVIVPVGEGNESPPRDGDGSLVVVHWSYLIIEGRPLRLSVVRTINAKNPRRGLETV